jgi:translation elongation factor EF-1alpha
MSEKQEPSAAIGTVTHWFGHISVAAVRLNEPLAVGDKIHIKGHSTDLVQTVSSMEVEHNKIDLARPGDDVALATDGPVHEHDLIFRET